MAGSITANIDFEKQIWDTDSQHYRIPEIKWIQKCKAKFAVQKNSPLPVW